VNDVVLRCRECPRHRIIHCNSSSIIDDGQGTKTGDFDGVGDGIAFELGIIWGDGDNDVGDFFVGDEFGEVFDLGKFHRHEPFDGTICPVGLDQIDSSAGGFCYVSTGDLGVVCGDGCVRRNTYLVGIYVKVSEGNLEPCITKIKIRYKTERLRTVLKASKKPSLFFQATVELIFLLIGRLRGRQVSSRTP